MKSKYNKINKAEEYLVNYSFCLLSIAIISFLAVSGRSCKKLVELPTPTDRILQANIYNNNEAAITVLTGIYTNMTGAFDWFTGSNSISLQAGLSADEFTLFSVASNARYIAYYQNMLTTNPALGSEYWSPFYAYLRSCNAALEGLNASNSITPSVKQQLTGEAKFMRAFFYFYLVNLFGDVPLALTGDYKANTQLTRTPKTLIYLQIIADLKDAQQLLSANYLDATLLNSTSERVRPTKWAATALLARVYLYTEDYVDAETQASSIINNSSMYKISAINNTFLKNSIEAIWQLQPTVTGFNTQDAVIFIIPSTGPSSIYPVQLSTQLRNSFEAGDQRYTNGNWVDTITILGTTYYYPYKYKVNIQNSAVASPGSMGEYLMVLRLGEQYLIRAEARAQQSNIEGAQSDLNEIRTRAGLGSTMANNKSSLLTAILHERQVELFSEWGHRWLDLKRTGNVDAVMNVVTPLKANGAAWQTSQQLYPLPLSDLQLAPNLVQNVGY